jgi:hypothetical protein
MNNQTESTIGSVEQTLRDCVKDASFFLSTLQTLYTMRRIGEDLSFAEIEAYWRGGLPLSDAWLDELGRSIRYESSQKTYGWREHRQQVAPVISKLLDGLEPSQWYALAEKSLYLLSPLQVPEHLLNWSVFYLEGGPKKIETDTWCARLAVGLLPRAKSLAEGEEGWQDLHLWMKQAGSDPGLLHTILTKFSIEKWCERDDYSLSLSAHLTVLVVMRLLLRAQGPSGKDWHKCLIPFTLLLTKCHAFPVNHQTLQRNHVAPILKAALRSSDLISSLSCQASSNDLRNLMNKFGMSIVLARQPERYQALVEKINSNRLLGFPPSEELVQTAPDLLFFHIRRRYERTGQLTYHKFTTPEALTWYRDRLPEIKDERTLSDCVEWLIERLPQVDTLAMLEQFCGDDTHLSYNTLDAIDNIAALQRFVGCANTALSSGAARRLWKLASSKIRASYDNEYLFESDPGLWPLLMDQCKRYPEVFIEATLYAYNLNSQELARWELLWQSTTKLDSRKTLVEALFNAWREEEISNDVDPLALAERLYQEDPKPFQAFVDEQYEGTLVNDIAAISIRNNALCALIPRMAARYLMQSTWPMGPIDSLNPIPVQNALVCYPDCYAALEDKAQVKLLALFNDQAVIACGATLAELFGKNNKSLYPSAVELIARTSLNALTESGLLDLSTKKARKLVLTGLGLTADPEAAPVLRQRVEDKAHDDFTRGLMLDNLESRGESIEELDDGFDLTLVQVQALAAKQKIPAAISQLWNADLAEHLGDLGEQGGLYLLYQIATGDGMRLPRKARQILELIPVGRRADFALLGVNQWIAENGNDKFNVLLPPLFEYGDERVANALVKATKAWKKTRKQKSSAAIRLLCQLPGSYGAVQAYTLWESRQFSDAIMNNARMALNEAAQREGMSFQEFIEQLVPDFGLDHKGLTLNVGPYVYQVKIKPDLSLLVVGPTGKTTKSLPKAKVDEDLGKRNLAEKRFKDLRKNLKPVLKQQSQRLLRGFMIGKRWNLAQWQKLFIDHPVMNIMAQGIVWGVEDDQGCSLARFRPSDSGERFDLENKMVSLEEAGSVHIIHPAEIDAEERTAWRTHFEIYAVTSPIGQWDVPVYKAEAKELDAERLIRQRNVVINRGTFGVMMEKWGYQKGPGEDGGMINGHTWLVSHGEWLVVCEHSGVSIFFDAYEEVRVEALVPHHYAPEEAHYPWKPVALKALPIALRATLLAQAEALIAAAKD